MRSEKKIDPQGGFRDPPEDLQSWPETLRFFRRHRLAALRRPNVCFRRLEDASRFLRDASSTPPRRIILIPNPMHMQLLFPLHYFTVPSLSCIISNTVSKYQNMQKTLVFAVFHDLLKVTTQPALKGHSSCKSALCSLQKSLKISHIKTTENR